MAGRKNRIKVTDMRGNKPWLKSRQRSRVAVVVRSKRTFLILCEGQTEADYFLAFSNERIAVTAHDLGCAGKSLVDCALQYRDDGSFDEVWCVYDLDYSRGNVKAQANKQVSLISYNIFNLPRQITKSGQVFEVIYDGAGRKLAQIDLQGNRKDYLAGLELNNGSFESLYHPQGRAAYSNGSWSYQYVLQDHLGNTRAVFKNAVGGGAELIESHTYFPFGMKNEGLNTGTQGYPYRYNGKEQIDDIGLYDYGARWYDPAVARWTNIDPLADQYKKISPYAYTANNPIRYIDPDGMRIDVDTKEKKDGTTKVKIKYTGVLQTDGVDLSRKELRQMRRQIKKQLKSSFSVNGDGVKSKVKVKLRIGGAVAADDNRIILTNAANPNLKGGNGRAPDGFDAFVNAERGADAVVKTAVHEVGHNMGLPHNVSDVETRTETRFGIDMSIPTFLAPNTISPGHPAAGNLMLPGTQVTAAGTSVTASQIRHISRDASSGKLNRRDMGGGGEPFGVFPTDRPLVDINGNVTRQ